MTINKVDIFFCIQVHSLLVGVLPLDVSVFLAALFFIVYGLLANEMVLGRRSRCACMYARSEDPM